MSEAISKSELQKEQFKHSQWIRWVAVIGLFITLLISGLAGMFSLVEYGEKKAINKLTYHQTVLSNKIEIAKLTPDQDIKLKAAL